MAVRSGEDYYNNEMPSSEENSEGCGCGCGCKCGNGVCDCHGGCGGRCGRTPDDYYLDA